MTKAFERWIIISEATLCHSCALIFCCVLKRGLKPSNPVRLVSDLQECCLCGAAPSITLSPSYHHVGISPGLFYMPGISRCIWERNPCDIGRPPMQPKILSWFIHRAYLTWAQQGHTVGSKCWALADTWEGKEVKDKKNKTCEKHNYSSID